MVKTPGTLKEVITTLFPLLSVDQYRTINRSSIFIRLNPNDKACIRIELERDKERQPDSTVKKPIYNWNWVDYKIIQNLMSSEILDLIKKKWEN